MDRQIIDTREDIWRVRTWPDGGGYRWFNWTLFRPRKDEAALDERSIDILKLAAAWMFATKKAATVNGLVNTVHRFLRWYPSFARRTGRDPKQVGWSKLDEPLFDAFLTHGVLNTVYGGNDFSRIRAFYRWGALGLELPDFDPEVLAALETRRAPRAPKGALVRGHDPKRGPLDADEQALVISAIQQGVGSDRDRAIVMLHLELGLNSEAAARLWTDGLEVYEARVIEPGGTPRCELAYHLAVPRMKKRTELRQTRHRPLSRELGDLLLRLRDGEPDGRLLHWLGDGDPRASICWAMRDWVRSAGLVSPRTGLPLHLTPRRFRYTLATEMAREGASRHKIADLLDHSDLQNVEVYIEASSYIASQVADRFDPGFEVVLRRFQGKVVAQSDFQPFPGLKRKVIPGAVVHLPMLPVNLGGIGACGRDAESDGICKLAPPLSCYSCDKFAAFREVNHRSIGDALEKVISTRFGALADERIPRQLVNTLHAVRQLEHQIADERALTEVAP
ncbi:MAG TPA: site-specific integrase [Chloroflexota bacterium]|nr:site-specific integrase [Chloroflexota bacterium]